MRRALYEKVGYRQYDQRVVNGYPRVFLRKALGAAYQSFEKDAYRRLSMQTSESTLLQ